jgi:hypothetical protein
MSDSRINAYPMEELAPIVCQLLDRGKSVVIPAKGNSMRPLVRSGKDNIVLTAYKGQPLLKGDAIFYKRKNGSFVLHRIVAINIDGSFTVIGDNQVLLEKGVTKEQVIALPTMIIRGKREIDCNSPLYKKYSLFWSDSVVLRKIHYRLFFLPSWIKAVIKKFFNS